MATTDEPGPERDVGFADAAADGAPPPIDASLEPAARGGNPLELLIWPAVIILTYYPIYYLIDVHLTRLLPKEALYQLYWPAVDGRIPFWPTWQLAYVLVYIGAALPVFVVRDPLLIRRAAFCYLTSMAIAFAFFILMPVTAEEVRTRAGPNGDEDFFHWIARLHFHWDAAGNCFPSLHVAIALNAAFVVGYASRPAGIVAFAGAILIALSTVFVKQHYFVDAVAGLFVGCVGERIFLRGYEKPPPGAPPAIRGNGAFVAYVAVYIVGIAITYAIYRTGFRPWAS